jgi:hypothetical protein
MSGIISLSRVINLKMSPAQVRRVKAAAKQQGMRFSTWARDALLEKANRIIGGNSGVLEAPSLPVDR